MDTGTSMVHKRLRRGCWGLTGRWGCQRLCDVSVAFSADKGLAERFLLLKSTLFVGGLERMSVCVPESLVCSHSHMKHAHTHPRTSSPLCSLLHITALTSDFCQSLSIREKWHIHMSSKTGEEGGFFFLFSVSVSDSQDAGVPFLKSRYGVVFCLAALCCWFVISPRALASTGSTHPSTLGYTKLKGVLRRCQGP